MFELHWLSDQARSIHDLFVGIFYVLAVVLILLGVLTEYFKLPLGTGAGVGQLVVRTLIASLLLHSYPEITNTISDVTDAIAGRIGDLNSFHLVLGKMGDKLQELTFSWTSVKDSVILVFSFVTFFVLYISVFIADAGIVFVWTILYIFSPILLVLYILPATAFATSSLFRSLIEVSAWKIVWAVLAALLWSSALGKMNVEGSKLSFLTVIAYNLILAISLLLTPLVVHALASTGITQATSSWLGLAAGAAAFSPGRLARAAATRAPHATVSAVKNGLTRLQSRFGERTKTSFSENGQKTSPRTRESRDSPKSPGSSRSPASPTSKIPTQRRISPMSETPDWVKNRQNRENSKGKLK